MAKKDIWCAETPLPMTIHGFVCRRFGIIYMFINSLLSPAAKKEAIEHEFEHIDNNDLYSDEYAIVIEGKTYSLIRSF